MRALIVNSSETFSEAAYLMLAALFPAELLDKMNLPPAVLSKVIKIQSEEDDYIGTAFAIACFFLSTRQDITASDRVVLRNISSAFFTAVNFGAPCDKSALDMADVLKDESWTKSFLTAIPDSLRFTSNKKYTKVGGKAEEVLRISDYISGYDSDSELAQDLLPDLGEGGDDERSTGRGFIANTATQVSNTVKDILNME